MYDKIHYKKKKLQTEKKKRKDHCKEINKGKIHQLE